MQNIDLFNEYVAIILSRLYERFPVRQDLPAWQISGQRNPAEYGKVLPTNKAESNKMEVAFFTVDWLVENGYVRARNGAILRFNGCVLSEKGLELLNSTPDSLQQSKETIGESLIRLLKEGSKDAAKGVVTQLLTLGIG